MTILEVAGTLGRASICPRQPYGRGRHGKTGSPLCRTAAKGMELVSASTLSTLTHTLETFAYSCSLVVSHTWQYPPELEKYLSRDLSAPADSGPSDQDQRSTFIYSQQQRRKMQVGWVGQGSSRQEARSLQTRVSCPLTRNSGNAGYFEMQKCHTDSAIREEPPKDAVNVNVRVASPPHGLTEQ